MATLHRTDGSTADLPVGRGRKGLTLQQMQEAVGGYIEIVYLEVPSRRHPSRVLIINEEGRLEGLPVNHWATAQYRGTPPRHDGIIVGDVIEATVHHGGTARERIA